MARFTGRNLFLNWKLPSPNTPTDRSSASPSSTSGSAFGESPSLTPKLAPKLNSATPSSRSRSRILTIANSRPPRGASAG